MNFEYYLENKRFVEILYFGSMQLSSNRSAKLHLYLGLSCAAAVAPIACIQRMMNNSEEANVTIPLNVSRGTLLVYDSVRHFVAASQLDPDIRIPNRLFDVASQILSNLQDYLSQEFHGFRSPLGGYSLRTYGVAAISCISALCENKVTISQGYNLIGIESAEKLLEELRAQELGHLSKWELPS